MHIYNIEEHLSCFCYEKGDNPLIEVRKIGPLETDELSLLYNEIVLVMKGRIRFTINNNISTEVSKGNMVLLPASKLIRYKAFTGSLVLILRLKDEMQLCHTYNLERLNSNIKMIGKPDNMVTLAINARLQHFANGLLDTYEDGLKCRFYLQAKITEALIMLRAFYAEEQLFLFFYHSLTSDTLFAEYVQTNHLKYPTVNKLAEAMNMTAQQFSRRFSIIFGEAPYGWMLREKARLIYGDICRSNKPIKEIAKDYGFPIQANFNRFCKMEFNMNPREIRKNRYLKSDHFDKLLESKELDV